jgi:hypothetical protein
MVDEDGGLVIANDSCLVRSTTTWQHADGVVPRRGRAGAGCRYDVLAVWAGTLFTSSVI